jgi:hypothetical protein
MNIINTLDKSKFAPLLTASQFGHPDLNPYAIDNAGDMAFH